MLESARPERPFKVGDLLDAKRAADRASFAAHEAATNRGVKATAPVDDFEEKFQKAVGDVMRGELRSEVPGLGRQMQHSRELMGLEKSYFNAEARPGEKIGSNPVTSAIRMAMAPAASSRRAISLNRFSLEQPAARAGTAVVKQLPRYLGTIRRPSGQEE
jgi:hypothetical protein